MPSRTKQEREAHLRLLEKALVDGIEPDDLIAVAPERFGLTAIQARRDLKTVYQRLAAAGERLRRHDEDDVQLALSYKRRGKALREAVSKGNAKLLGIYAGERTTELDDDLGGQDLDAAIESELAKLAAASQAAHAAADHGNGRSGNGRLTIL